jgi:hypothetical protein
MKLKKAILVIIVLIFSSCGLKPISSEYNLIKNFSQSIDLQKLGNGTILIYNGADILHKVDNTANLNIWINDKALGQLQPSEYVIINLLPDSYNFKVLHKDLVNIRSEHTLEINEQTKVIIIKPNITSNKTTITNELPQNFLKFRNALK